MTAPLTFWTTYGSADGSVPFAVFVNGHQAIDFRDAGILRALAHSVMSLGYSLRAAKEWVEGAELGQFWLAPNGKAGEDGQPIFVFAGSDQPGALKITGAKFQ